MQCTISYGQYAYFHRRIETQLDTKNYPKINGTIKNIENALLNHLHDQLPGQRRSKAANGPTLGILKIQYYFILICIIIK